MIEISASVRTFVLPRLCLATVLGLAAGACRLFALGGTGAAPINEAAIVVTLHVNPTAPPGGNGSLNSPFNTLQTALNRAINAHNAAGQGVRVLLAPGIYREGTVGNTTALTLPSPSTSAPVVIEGSGWAPGVHTGDVVISGSELWNGGWVEQGDGTWSKPWPYRWGIGPNPSGGGNPPDVMRRYELVHVNGVTYYQVLGPADPNLAHLTSAEGAFWVDETAATITLRPPSSLGDLNVAVVEVTTKRRLLHHFRPQATLTPTNIALRNLVFQHGASGLNGGVVMLQNAIGLTVEDCVVRQNKQMGLFIAGINSVFTVRRTVIDGNGEMGSGFQGVNILAEDVRWTNNSRQADIVRYYGWGYGGIKIGVSSNLTFRRVEASGNYGMGLWFDTGNVNCLVEDSLIINNTSQGIWSENNNRNNIAGLGDTPTVVVRRCYIAGNYRRSPQATVRGGGFYITEAENSRIEDSVIFDNAIQFRISDGPGRGPINRTTVRGSILASRQGVVQDIYATGYGTVGWQQFFDTLTAETGENEYYFSGTSNGVAALEPQPQPASTIAFYSRWQALSQSLAGWKALHAVRNADQTSRWNTNYHGQPLVTVAADAAHRQQTGGTVSAFTLHRVTPDLAAPLTVHYTAGGTAQSGVHYAPFSGTATFPAGALEVSIAFTPLDQANPYGERTVAITLNASDDYVAPLPSAQFVLEDDVTANTPRVSVAVAAAIASEEARTPAIVTFVRSGSTTAPLTINYLVGGTAAPARYEPLPGSVTFPAGAASVDVAVVPLDDNTPQLTETVTLSVASGAGYVLSSQLPTDAQVEIRDNDIVSPLSVTTTPNAAPLNVEVVLHNPDPEQAQTFTITLPTHVTVPGYEWTDSTMHRGPVYEWNEPQMIAGTTELTELREQDDYVTRYANGQGGAEGGIPLGFAFPLYGRTYDRLWIQSNGVLHFGGRGTTAATNEALPVGPDTLFTDNDTAALLWAWDNLRFVETPPASRAFLSRPTADTVLLTFENLRHAANLNRLLTCQVRLRADGEILVRYREVGPPADAGATVGLQGTNAEGQPFLQVAHNSTYLQSGLALRLRRAPAWLNSTGNPVQVTVPPASTASFTLTFTPAKLALGRHSTTLSITSDHPGQPEIALPVELLISTHEIPPAAPAEISASALSATAIGLAWSDDADNETGYSIARALSPMGPFSFIGSVGADITTFIDSPLSPATAYHYRVVAFNEAGTSAPSGSVSSATLTLGQYHGAIGFASAAAAVAADAATAVLTVTRQGVGGGAVTVSFATTDGTAQAGVDYHPTDGTVAWTDGDLAPKTIAVPLLGSFPAGARDFRVRLVATTGGAVLGADDEAVVTIRPLSQAWQRDHFSEAQLADPALESTLWGWHADPDGDGWSNLLEYALAMNPLSGTPDGGPLLATLNGHLQLSFSRARPELDYEVLASSDLATWNVEAVNPGSVGETVTFLDPVSLAAAPRRFLRLRVTQP